MAYNYQVPPRFLHNHRPAPPPFASHQPPLADSETFSYYLYDIPQYLSQIVAEENAARYDQYMRFIQPGLPPRFRNIPANNRSYNHSYDQGFSPDGQISPSFYHQEDETLMLFEDIDAFLDDQNFSSGGNTLNGTGSSGEIIDKNMKTRIVGKHDKDDEVCVICQDDFHEDQKFGMLDNCVHVCHAECMKNWLMQKNICPICKATGLNIVD